MYEHWYSHIASLASILSLLAYFFERFLRKTAEKNETQRIWSEISKIKGIMVDVERDIQANTISSGALQAHGALTMLFRDLLKEAVQREKKFSIHTITIWRKTGKLSSDWQEKLALTLLHTDQIRLSESDDIDLEKHQSADAVPHDSPVYHVLSTNKS